MHQRQPSLAGAVDPAAAAPRRGGSEPRRSPGAVSARSTAGAIQPGADVPKAADLLVPSQSRLTRSNRSAPGAGRARGPYGAGVERARQVIPGDPSARRLAARSLQSAGKCLRHGQMILRSPRAAARAGPSAVFVHPYDGVRRRRAATPCPRGACPHAIIAWLWWCSPSRPGRSSRCRGRTHRWGEMRPANCAGGCADGGHRYRLPASWIPGPDLDGPERRRRLRGGRQRRTGR